MHKELKPKELCALNKTKGKAYFILKWLFIEWEIYHRGHAYRMINFVVNVTEDIVPRYAIHS